MEQVIWEGYVFCGYEEPETDDGGGPDPRTDDCFEFDLSLLADFKFTPVGALVCGGESFEFPGGTYPNGASLAAAVGLAIAGSGLSLQFEGDILTIEGCNGVPQLTGHPDGTINSVRCDVEEPPAETESLPEPTGTCIVGGLYDGLALYTQVQPDLSVLCYALDGKQLILLEETMSIQQGSFTPKDTKGCVPDRETIRKCFIDSDSDIDFAALEAAVAASGNEWDNGDAVGGIASDNAVLVGLSWRVLKCGDKKPDGTSIKWDGSEAQCAVKVVDEGGNDSAIANGGGGQHGVDALVGTYEAPVEFSDVLTIFADATDGTAGVEFCLIIERKYDSTGAVLALAK